MWQRWLAKASQLHATLRRNASFLLLQRRPAVRQSYAQEVCPLRGRKRQLAANELDQCALTLLSQRVSSVTLARFLFHGVCASRLVTRPGPVLVLRAPCS